MTLRHAILVLVATGVWCLAGAIAYGALWPADQAQWMPRLAVIVLAAVGGACLATASSVDTIARSHAVDLGAAAHDDG